MARYDEWLAYLRMCEEPSQSGVGNSMCTLFSHHLSGRRANEGLLSALSGQLFVRRTYK
jgi:hypothetical protein